jgi:hypothetical protein
MSIYLWKFLERKSLQASLSWTGNIWVAIIQGASEQFAAVYPVYISRLARCIL